MVRKYNPRHISTVWLTLSLIMFQTLSTQGSVLGFASILSREDDGQPFEYDPLYFSGPEGEQKYAQCLSNLNAATKKTDGILTRKAFLIFLSLQSNGQIKEKNFNASIIQFVHVYWVATCSVNPTGCTASDGEPLADILAYQDADGQNLGYEICERMDVILNRWNSAAPTMRSPSMATPTQYPAPHQAPSAQSSAPSNSPSRRPTVSPTVSAAPTQAPTFGDSFTLTFSIEYTVVNPKSLIQTWSYDIVASVLQRLDARCAIVGGLTSTTCPFTYQSDPFIIDRSK